eukprot:gene12226-biopygen5678
MDLGDVRCAAHPLAARSSGSVGRDMMVGGRGAHILTTNEGRLRPPPLTLHGKPYASSCQGFVCSFPKREPHATANARFSGGDVKEGWQGLVLRTNEAGSENLGTILRTSSENDSEWA